MVLIQMMMQSKSIELLDDTIRLLGSLREGEIHSDQNFLDNISNKYRELYSLFERKLAKGSIPSIVNTIPFGQKDTNNVGRPSYNIPAEDLENLRGLGFTWTKISKLFGVSRWTIYRRVKEYDIPNVSGFSHISDDRLDQLVTDFSQHSNGSAGQSLVIGHIKSLGYRVQRRRIRKSLVRIDPENAALRWGIIIKRRKYSVPWPNSLWHLDGHHSLIRWGLVIHGCIDGYSRRIMFLSCSSNNLSDTVLTHFLKAINDDGGMWPSRIRVDYGVENVKVCDEMIRKWGEGRGSFIAGSSTRNQRIERLWRDVFKSVCHVFYYTFYALEDSGMLDIDSCVDMFALHAVFIPRINQLLLEFSKLFNDHPVRTEKNWTPNQMWTNGMLHPENPLARGELDTEVNDFNFYGIDIEGPSPFEESSNNVTVPRVDIPRIDMELATRHIMETIKPLRESNHMGIDIFEEAKDYIIYLVKNLAE